MTHTRPQAGVASSETTSRWRRVRPLALLAGGLLAVSVLLHLRDPHRSGSWGYCPWLMLTGTYCPGCGGLRAVNDLTRGDVAAAVSSNLMLIACAPVFVAWWLRSFADRWRGSVRHTDPRVIGAGAAAFCVLALGFAVLRNTAVPWLAP